MGFEGVLVDRGRILRKSGAVKVGGRTTFVDSEPGEWFACRLFLPQSPESYDPARVSKRVVIAPTLMYGTDDEEGNQIEVRLSDRIEVESDDLGVALWQVTGAPQSLRKKEGILGWQATLKRLEYPATESVA
jgi:hypothetical protein